MACDSSFNDMIAVVMGLVIGGVVDVLLFCVGGGVC